MSIISFIDQLGVIKKILQQLVDFFIHARRHETKNSHGLRDVLQLVLAGILQHVAFFNPLRGLRSHHDLAAFGQPRDARREVGRRPRRRESPVTDSG